MSVASRIISTIQGRGSWGPTDDRWYYPGGPYYGGYGTESGMSVSSENAMRLITVHNCVRVRAFTIGQLPCHIMELKGGMKRQATDFYLYELLHDQPNTWMTAFEFWAMAEAHLCLRGNFYVYKIGLPGRPVQMLIPLKDGTVDQITQNDDYTLTYQVRFATGEKKPIPGDKIMHFRGLTLDGITGVNPIEYARESIGKGLASERHLSRWFGKGMHPSAVIKHPLPLGVQAHRDRRKALEEKYQGLGQDYEFMLIDEGMSIDFPKISMVDAQFLEQMKLSEAQICGLFRVPLMLVQAGVNTPTYASAEQFMLSYLVYGVAPDAVNYEKAIRRDLLTLEERKRYYAKFNLNAILRADFGTRMNGYQTAITSRIMNPNEARDLEDMNPYPGGDSYENPNITVRKEAQGAAK